MRIEDQREALDAKVSKKQRILELEAELGNLKREAAKGRLVIMYAKAGEHLVPVFDQMVTAASVEVDNDYQDVTVFGGTKTDLVGPSVITIRVTR